jgi:hypothetical protein
MPRNDPKDLQPPMHYKARRAARHLSEAEIKAAADRAEARSMLTATRLTDNPRNSSAAKLEGAAKERQSRPE